MRIGPRNERCTGHPLSKEVHAVRRRVRVRDHFSGADLKGGFRMTQTSPVSETLYGLLGKIDDALSQAQDCLRDEAPEDMTREEAREDTISKVREAMGVVDQLRGHAQRPAIDAEQEAKNLSAVIDYINTTSARLFEPNHVVSCIAFVRDRLQKTVADTSTDRTSK